MVDHFFHFWVFVLFKELLPAESRLRRWINYLIIIELICQIPAALDGVTMLITDIRGWLA